MAQEAVNVYRLYMTNVEQQQLLKRPLFLGLTALGALNFVYFAAVHGSITSAALSFLFFLLVYLGLGDTITGLMAFRGPERVIRWAGKQKLRNADETSAAELVLLAARKLARGNVTEGRKLLDQVFRLGDVSSSTLRFGYSLLADSQREEGDLEACLRTLKGHVIAHKKASSLAFMVMGRALLQQGKTDKATEAMEEALKLYLEHDYGVPKIKAGEIKLIKNVFQQTLEVFVPYYLAQSYMGSGNPQKAAAHLKSALSRCRSKFVRDYLKEHFEESPGT